MNLGAVRFLLVEDHAETRELIRSILQGAGATEVQQAASAHQGFERLRSHTIDLLIVDHHLGAGATGLELARRIRRDPASVCPFLPMILITGQSDLALVRAARDEGINEILIKPFTAAGLLRRVEALIFKPRPFITSREYIGPDRRRRNQPFNGPERRRAPSFGAEYNSGMAQPWQTASSGEGESGRLTDQGQTDKRDAVRPGEPSQQADA